MEYLKQDIVHLFSIWRDRHYVFGNQNFFITLCPYHQTSDNWGLIRGIQNNVSTSVKTKYKKWLQYYLT